MESLADTGLATMKRFKLLQEVELESVQDRSHEWPRHLFLAQFDRFELWAMNLGAFVMGHGSLDYRIRDSDSMKEAILKMMKNLNRSLDEVLAYLNGNIEQEDEDTDSDSEMESDMDLLLDSIKDPIDRLYKMAVWIRNPAIRIPSTKARNWQQIDEETNVDLFKSFESFDYDYVSSLFLEYEKNKALQESPTAQPEAQVEDESYLVRRIAQANGLRRKQFAYWRKHKNKLREHATIALEIPTHDLPTANHFIQLEDKNDKFKATLSVTTATQLRLSHGAEKEIFERDNIKNFAISEYAPSAWNPSNDIVRFPAPPKGSTATEFFECPYCYTICPASFLSEKAWRAHLIRDLRPYICTYERCLTSQQLYDTRDDWIQHEASMHQNVFHCPQHEEKILTTLEAYKEHMKENHEEDSMSLDLAKSTITNIHQSCPICSIVLGTIQKLQSHIALHLERFAMFALPRTTNDDEEDGSKHQASNYSSNSRLSCNSTVDSRLSLTERLDAAEGADISTKEDENSDVIMGDILDPDVSSRKGADSNASNERDANKRSSQRTVYVHTTSGEGHRQSSGRAPNSTYREQGSRSRALRREYDAAGRNVEILRTRNTVVMSHARRDYERDESSPRYRGGYQ